MKFPRLAALLRAAAAMLDDSPAAQPPQLSPAKLRKIVPMRERPDTRNAAWVSKYLNTSPQTVGRLIEDGTLRAYKLRDGGPWHVFLDSVYAYEKKIAAQMRKKGAGPDDAA